MTAANQAAARNEVMALLNTAWLANGTSADVPLLWDNVSGNAPPKPDSTGKAEAGSWARAQMRHNVGGQVSLADDQGRRRWRRSGIITVEVYTPLGTGFDRLHDELVQIVKDAFEGKTTVSDIIFSDVAPREIGPDGPWFQSNVLIAFEYDEVK